MKNQISLLLISLTAALVSACASVPMASLIEDTEGKKFEIPADKARIYLYRNETMGSAIKIPVTLDGKMMGQTAKDVYFAWDVPPGKHELSCLAASNSTLSVNTFIGKAAYVWQEMKMGLWVAGCQLHEVEESVGKKAVLETKRAASK